jgi:broad specificity phosphatase PhoE
LEVLVANHWKINPAVPIRGGDSWSSFHKRFAAAVQRIMSGTVALVTDELGIRALRGLDQPVNLAAPLRADKIYVIRNANDATHNPALPMAAGAA